MRNDVSGCRSVRILRMAMAGDGTTKSVLLRQVNLYSSVRLRFRWEAQLSLYFFALTPQLDLAPGQDILSAQQV